MSANFSSAMLELAACGNSKKSQNVGLKDLLPRLAAAETGGVEGIAGPKSNGYLHLRP